jgi:hypothetical protein
MGYWSIAGSLAPGALVAMPAAGALAAWPLPLRASVGAWGRGAGRQAAGQQGRREQLQSGRAAEYGIERLNEGMWYTRAAR